MASSTHRRTASGGLNRRPPPWRDIRVLRIGAQVLFVAAVGGAIVGLGLNLVANMRSQGIGTDFGFLDRAAGFQIAGSDFRSSQPILDALLVGVKNTALVSVLGVALATVLGVVVGIARLSTNWLVARAASLYVESLRNVPVLVIIIFWSTAVLLKLPSISDPTRWPAGVVLSNRGLWLPWLETRTATGGLWLFVGLGVLAAAIVWRWRTHTFEATGEPHHRVAYAAVVVAGAAVVGYVLTGRPIAISTPELTGRTVIGGTNIAPEYAAVLFGLVVYTASHVAEIVRGSILSVPKGQTEAATAVALGPWQRLRLVILPQAFRVAVPPLANQYLNLTKNSSLGIAVGYAEITAVSFIVIGNANPAPQVIGVMMAFYLAFSLVIAAITNVVNRRLQVP